MTKGGRESKIPGYGNFQSVPRYRKRTDQKPPITMFFLLPSPVCHSYSEPSGHEDSPGPPVPGAKMHPEIPGNKYISSFGQLWVIQPPSLIKIIQKIQRVTIERKISSSKEDIVNTDSFKLVTSHHFKKFELRLHFKESCCSYDPPIPRRRRKKYHWLRTQMQGGKSAFAKHKIQ